MSPPQGPTAAQPRPTRRGFTTGAAAFSIAAIAGCGGDDSDGLSIDGPDADDGPGDQPSIPVDDTGTEPRFEARVLYEHGPGPGSFAEPKMIVTPAGALLVVAQDRQGDQDWGDPILPITFESNDGGRSWTAPAPLLGPDFADTTRYFYAPTGLVADRETGRIFAFIQRNPLAYPNGEPVLEFEYFTNVQETLDLGRAWFLVHSDDDGLTWSEPRDITGQFIVEPHCGEYSPVHSGVQLTTGPRAGRMVVPVRRYCAEADGLDHDFDSQFNGLVYSDDGGDTWTTGAQSEFGLGECAIIERTDGAVYLNHRTARSERRLPERMQQVSPDGGETLTPVEPSGIVDNRAHAGLAAVLSAGGDPLFVLTSLPVEEGFRNRRSLSTSVSTDQGETWTTTRVIEPGPAGYSDVVTAADGMFVVIYETGADTSRRDLAVARFNRSWALARPS